MGYARVGSNPAHSVWGISSNGRALALHARGRGIDALILQLIHRPVWAGRAAFRKYGRCRVSCRTRRLILNIKSIILNIIKIIGLPRFFSLFFLSISLFTPPFCFSLLFSLRFSLLFSCFSSSTCAARATAFGRRFCRPPCK